MDTKKAVQFLEIVKQQSIKKASEALGIDQSALSRSLKSLEEELGCQLYVHYGKTFKLTEAGDTVLKYFQRMIAVDEDLARQLSSQNGEPCGHLNVVASSGFVHFLLLDTLTDFAEQNKRIALSVKTNDLKQNFDVDTDVCIGPKIEAEGIESRLMYSYRLKMYASQRYLEARGHPQSPSDLDHHDLIAYSQSLKSSMMDFDWHLRYGAPNGVPRKPFLEITSSYALKQVAEMGLGVITFSKLIIDKSDTNLVNLFPDEGVDVNLCFSYRKEQESNPALIRYRDYILDYCQKLNPDQIRVDE